MSSSTSRLAPPSSPATFRFMAVSCWLGGGSARLWADGGSHAVVDLPAATAAITLPEPPGAQAAAMADLDALCTVSSALLLGRLDRALIHAAGVVDPRGGAWLLAGDTHSGKTTTSLNLVRAGWPYLSDDHVILARGTNGGISAEGWPRRFRVDAGWKEGTALGRRVQVDPGAFWPGRWRREAPLAGMIFPRVEGHSSTLLTRLHPADALGRAVRAMPWLFFDSHRAPLLLELLRSAAALPAYELRLGADVYRDAERLLAVLAPVLRATL